MAPPNRDEIKSAIFKVVTNKGPIKENDLVLDVMAIINPVRFESVNYDAAIEELIKEKEIFKYEYILPHTLRQIKSLYFLKGTNVNIGPDSIRR